MSVHFDTDRKIDSRRLTGVLYLNPDWRDSDGGSIRLFPFPHPPIDITPIHDRLVLFDSTRMLHRVMPSLRQRVCVSLWWWQDEDEWRQQLRSSINDDTQFAKERLKALEEIFADATPTQLQTLTHLLTPAYLPHLTKLFYAHDWFASLEESHDGTSEPVQQMLVNHIDEVEMIDRALSGPLAQLRTRTESNPTNPVDARVRHEWKSWFPIEWNQPPKLPKQCKFIRSTRKNLKEPSLNQQPNSNYTASPKRLIHWMGSQ